MFLINTMACKRIVFFLRWLKVDNITRKCKIFITVEYPGFCPHRKMWHWSAISVESFIYFPYCFFPLQGHRGLKSINFYYCNDLISPCGWVTFYLSEQIIWKRCVMHMDGSSQYWCCFRYSTSYHFNHLIDKVIFKVIFIILGQSYVRYIILNLFVVLF